MPLLKANSKRAESARINGAKATGQKTPEGMFRSQTARYKHGLYATRGFMLPGESVEEFTELQCNLREFWQPMGFYALTVVNQMAGNLWETWRLQAAKNDHIHDVRATIAESAPKLKDDGKLNLLAENRAGSEGGTIERNHARLNFLARQREQMERSLLRLERRGATSGSTQNSLIINGRQHPDIPATQDAEPQEGTLSEGPYIMKATEEPLPETFSTPPPPNDPEPQPGEQEPQPDSQPENIVNWAETALGFQPDDFQKEVLTEQSKRIMILAPRQTGKSTAVAVRVLHEALANDNAMILLASASGRQSGQIMEKARKMALSLDLKILPPPPKCDGFTLTNGSQIVSLPDSEETIRGFSAPRLIVVDEAAFASESVFQALEPMLLVSNGTLIILSTPNGQTGYFYDQWHADPTPWTKLFGSLERCPRVSPEAIETIRKSVTKEVFEQEFECKFVASNGQVISLETLRKCYRDDFDLFDPEYDLEGVN